MRSRGQEVGDNCQTRLPRRVPAAEEAVGRGGLAIASSLVGRGGRPEAAAAQRPVAPKGPKSLGTTLSARGSWEPKGEGLICGGWAGVGGWGGAKLMGEGCSRKILKHLWTVHLSGAPGIQINVPAIHPNALPPNIIPSSSPGSITPAVSGPMCGGNHYITPAFSGVTNTGTKKWGKGGTTGKIGESFARRANVLS